MSLTRFDLWPVALVACALWALAARRDGTAGVLLGLAHRRQAVARARAADALVVAARRGSLTAHDARRGARRRHPVRVRARTLARGLWHALSLQASRPLQIESLAASTLVSLDRLGRGGPYSVVTSSGSQNLTGGCVGVAGVLSTLALVAVLVTALDPRHARRAERP